MIAAPVAIKGSPLASCESRMHGVARLLQLRTEQAQPGWNIGSGKLPKIAGMTPASTAVMVGVELVASAMLRCPSRGPATAAKCKTARKR